MSSILAAWIILSAVSILMANLSKAENLITMAWAVFANLFGMTLLFNFLPEKDVFTAFHIVLMVFTLVQVWHQKSLINLFIALLYIPMIANHHTYPIGTLRHIDIQNLLWVLQAFLVMGGCTYIARKAATEKKRVNGSLKFWPILIFPK